MNSRCPPQENLIDLLREQSPELHRHVERCAACQQALAGLKEPFVALGNIDPAAPSPAVMHRIESALFESLRVKELPAGGSSPRLLWGALTALLLSGITLVLLGLLLKHEVRLAPAVIGFWILPALALPALALPPRSQAAALAALLVGGLLLGLIDLSGVQVRVFQGVMCLLLQAGGALLPAATLWWFCKDTRRTAVGGGLWGLSVASGGAVMQWGICPLGGLPHVALLHLGPLFLLAALGALLGRAQRPQERFVLQSEPRG